MIIAKIIDRKCLFETFPEYGFFFKNHNLVVPNFSVFVLKKWFHNETQPTKADLIKNCIYIKGNQLRHYDSGAWLVHELAHLYFHKKNGVFFNKPYPENIEEEFAFSCQFLFLKEQGINKSKAFNIIRNAYSPQDFWAYRPIFEHYWKQINKIKLKNICI